MSIGAAGLLTIEAIAATAGMRAKVEADAYAAGIAGGAAMSKGLSRGTLAGPAMAAIGRNLTLGLTAPLVLIGVSSVKAAASFESSMSQTAQVLDKPLSGMKRLKDMALDLGTTTQFSAGEVGTAITNLAKGGFTEAEIAGGALKTTLDLAAAGGVNLGDAANYVNAAMNTFGIKARDSSEIADALAGAANASSADVAQLAQGLSTSGNKAALANQSLSVTVGFLAALSDYGINGAEAGTTFGSMLQHMLSPTQKASDLMKKLGISFYNAGGHMRTLTGLATQLQKGLKGQTEAERNAALMTITGSYGLKAAKVLYDQGASGLRRYIAAAREAGTAQEAANARMGPLQRSLKELSGTWGTFTIAVGEALSPLVQLVTGGLKVALKIFTVLPGPIQTVVVGIGLLAAATGPAILGVGALARALLALEAVSAGKLAGAAAITASETAAKSAAARVVMATRDARVSAASAAKEAAKADAARSASAEAAKAAAVSGFKDPEKVAAHTAAVKAEGEAVEKAGRMSNLAASDAALLATAQGKLKEGAKGAEKGMAAAGTATGKAGGAAGKGAAVFGKMTSGLSGMGGIFGKIVPILTKILPLVLRFAGIVGIAITAYQAFQWVADALLSVNDFLHDIGVNIPILSAALEQPAKMLGWIGDRFAQVGGAISSVFGWMGDQIDSLKAEAAIGELTKAQTAYTDAVSASKSVIDQRNAGTLQGTALTDEAKKSLGSQAEAAKSVSAAMVKTGAPSSELLATVQSQKAAFVANAVAMGFNQKQAEVLATSMGLIPKSVITAIKTKGAEEAKAALEKVDKRIRALELKKAEIKINTPDAAVADRKIAGVDKRINALKGKKVKIKADADEADKTARQLNNLTGELKGMSKEEIKVVADTTQATASIKETTTALEELQKEPYSPEVLVKEQVKETTDRITELLNALPDKTVHVNVVTSGSGGGGGNGGGGGDGESRGLGDNGILGATYIGPDGFMRSGGGMGLGFGARRGAGSSGRGGTLPVVRFTDPYQDWINNYIPRWLEALKKAGEAGALAQHRAYEDAQSGVQRSIEDQDQAWNRRREDIQTAWEKRKQKNIDQLRKSEQKLRDNADKTGGVSADERKQIAASAKIRRNAEHKFELQNRNRQRAQEDSSTTRSRLREDAATREARAREDAEKIAQDALAKTAEAEAAVKQAASDRVSANESVTSSLIAQRDQLRDKLSQSVQWGPSPGLLIRDLNASKALLAKYSKDLIQLQGRGLSKEAIAAMGAMDPKEAGRLASRLLDNPSLIGDLNSAYAGLISESSNVANETAAAQFEGVGGGMAAGILAGLAAGEPSLMDYITKLGASSLEAIKKVLGIKSPSKAFAGVGKNIGQGLIVGMRSTEKQVQRRAVNLVNIPSVQIPRGGDGAYLPAAQPIVQHIYPSQKMDERQTAIMVGRELSWSTGL